MKIDAWTHLLSPSYARQLEAAGGRGPGAFLLAQRALHDVDFRLSSIDLYDDYRQILTPVPGMPCRSSPHPASSSWNLNRLAGMFTNSRSPAEN